jgi:hypothetical protein
MHEHMPLSTRSILLQLQSHSPTKLTLQINAPPHTLTLETPPPIHHPTHPQQETHKEPPPNKQQMHSESRTHAYHHTCLLLQDVDNEDEEREGRGSLKSGTWEFMTDTPAAQQQLHAVACTLAQGTWKAFKATEKGSLGGGTLTMPQQT